MTGNQTKKKDGAGAVTIYHNPRCGTSRKVLAAIRDAGIEPDVIEYLKAPPSKARLKAMLKEMGLKPRDVVRSKQKEFGAAGLEDETLSDDAIVDAMLLHPVLINRPIVVTGKGTRLCRPAERVHEILP